MVNVNYVSQGLLLCSQKSNQRPEYCYKLNEHKLSLWYAVRMANLIHNNCLPWNIYENIGKVYANDAHNRLHFPIQTAKGAIY